ncbi:nuclear transport factor 2 family protein [Shewanella salipaludis]|uniref:Nuclear transport factor 2 family protein n=1 Tax=Shewanella salipaludis TaxID=2723052 RepID=A0A972G2K4_9GAMM|nr:nuclear transport factor 2 family protein [Shewanella salipaludis]NMH66346.1 nuclear transport factor 2 family protein [Shewanella salipaludis]
MSASAEVQALLAQYFDTLYYCDLEKFDAIFHPLAIYTTADETPLLHRDMPCYREVLARREPPAARKEPRRDLIDEIEFAGENTALARVRCSFGGRDFIDLLTLVRSEGRWYIMAKIFHVIAANGETHALR